MSSDLTKEEELEYYRQLRILDDPHFHEWAKCGRPLVPYSYHKEKLRKAKFHRQLCTVHNVIVSMSGWEIGFEGGSNSKALKRE
jgi:hypothetical protein